MYFWKEFQELLVWGRRLGQYFSVLTNLWKYNSQGTLQINDKKWGRRMVRSTGNWGPSWLQNYLVTRGTSWHDFSGPALSSLGSSMAEETWALDFNSTVAWLESLTLHFHLYKHILTIYSTRLLWGWRKKKSHRALHLIALSTHFPSSFLSHISFL